MTVQTGQNTSDWLAELTAPLSGAPCGEDPRYLDAFQQVKEEIDKLRGVNYEMILFTCRDLLTRVTKDLRLGGYHILAATYVEGLPGLADGLRAYLALLNNFWEECHPRNETARLAALKLLDNPKMLAFAEQNEQGVPRETFEALHREIGAIDAFLTGKLGEEVPRLASLGRWVGERLRRLAASDPPPAGHPEAQPTQSSEIVEGAVVRRVSSEQEVETLTRQLHRHLLDAGDHLRAMAYSRALRWGRLSLPPHEGGRTRIPAPRASGLAELEQILSGSSLESALTCWENLFFEPGFPLLFDLQFRAFQHLEANHRSDLAGFVRNALLDLLERHPQLSELHFDDGSPFAGPECREWIRQCRTGPAGGSGTAFRGPDADMEEAEALVDQAMRMAKRKKLPEALQTIHSLPAGSETARMRKRLFEARLCLAAGKASMAEVILEDLQAYILAQHLPTWDPGLAIEILQQRLLTLQSLEKNGMGEEKQQLAQQTQQVRQLICKIDLVAAATLI